MIVSTLARETIAQKTFIEFGTERLAALCDAVGAGTECDAFIRAFQRLLRPWGNRRIGWRPQYPSNVSDDEAPFEFSIALSNGPPELQAYVEPQGEPPTLRSNMKAGRDLSEALAREFGVPLDRLRAVERVFFPEDPCGAFTIWIGVSWAAGRELKFKVYLNPHVRGDAVAASVIAEAMERLGFARAWSTVRDALSSRDGRRDEVGILCLDLSNSEEARVKVYIRHHRATAKDIDAIASIAADYHAGDAAAFYGVIAGSCGPFLNKPALSELAFVEPAQDRPSGITLTFPIREYVENDHEASERIQRCMAAFGLQSDTYDKALRAFAVRPLDGGPGTHEHVTLRRMREAPRVGVYFASRAYAYARE